MLERLKAVLKELCEKWQCVYLEGNGEPNHFHLVFRFFPQTDLSKFIGNLKSVSSRKMNQEFSEHLGKTYSPKVSRRTGKRTAHTLWNESYAINSVGGARLDALIGYVQNQPKELLDKVTRGEF